MWGCFRIPTFLVYRSFIHYIKSKDMKVIENLFIARTLLALNQREAAEQAGIAQTIISLLERGEKKFIPTEYLQFLYNKGVDLNWLFNEKNHSAEIFRADLSPAHHPTLPPAQENSLSSLIVKGMSTSNEMEVRK